VLCVFFFPSVFLFIHVFLSVFTLRWVKP
jgi:hypothetical protein